MKRPILIALIGYIIGIIWGLYFKTSIAPYIIIFAIIYVICMKIHLLLKDKLKTILILIIPIIISNSITSYLNNKYKNIYNTTTEEQIYIGTIISDAEEGEYKSSYTIKIESIDGDTRYRGIKLILYISNNYNQKLEYGNKIKFSGTYTAPEIQRNYKGFDYSKYLKTLKIYGMVSCSKNKIDILKKQNVNSIKLITHEISTRIENNIKKIYEEKEANLLIGILLGNNGGIDEEIKEDFRNSGIYHILAVSGAHMSYVILGITFVLEKVDISKRKKNILKILGIIFFMLITNSSISVIRAGIMAGITIVAEIFYRKKDMINTVATSMLIILIYNPYSINSISFQLSYGGVIGILILNNFYIKLLSKTKISQKISKVISVILSAQTMIIPIMIINYHTISLTFLFANILVTYIIGIIIILGFICAFLSLISLEIAEFISIFLSVLLKILIYIAKFFGDIPLSKIYVPTPSMLSVVLYYILILMGMVPHDSTIGKCYISKIKKILIILLIITLIFNNYIYIPQNLKIHFIDIGQGDSCLIVTPNNKKILIDGGGTAGSSGSFDVGEDTLLPYLLDRGIRNLDYIVVSHFDTDHVRRTTYYNGKT